jgi:hypothetical protein
LIPEAKGGQFQAAAHSFEANRRPDSESFACATIVEHSSGAGYVQR